MSYYFFWKEQEYAPYQFGIVYELKKPFYERLLWTWRRLWEKEKHSHHFFSICPLLLFPSNSWPLGFWVLCVFKQVSCKYQTLSWGLQARELALRPPGPEKLQMFLSKNDFFLVKTRFLWNVFELYDHIIAPFQG